MGQSHFTLSFPLKSPADAKALAQDLTPSMPDLFRVEDAIGTVHARHHARLAARICDRMQGPRHPPGGKPF